MEILKDFSFDIQLFADLDLTASVLATGVSEGNSKKLYGTLENGVLVWSDGEPATGYVVALTATVGDGAFDGTGVTGMTVNSAGITNVYVKTDVATFTGDGAGLASGLTVVLDSDGNRTNGTVASLSLSGSFGVAAGALSSATSALELTAGTLTLAAAYTSGENITLAGGTTVTSTKDGIQSTGAGSVLTANAEEFTLKSGSFTSAIAGATYDVNAAADVALNSVTFASGAVGIIKGDGTEATLTKGSVTLGTDNSVTTLTMGNVGLALTAKTVGQFTQGANSITITDLVQAGNMTWTVATDMNVNGKIQFAAATGAVAGTAASGITGITVGAGSATLAEAMTLTVTANNEGLEFTSAKATITKDGAISNFSTGAVGVTTYTGTIGLTVGTITLSDATVNVGADGTMSTFTSGSFTTSSDIKTVTVNSDVYTSKGTDLTFAYNGSAGTKKYGVVNGTLDIAPSSSLQGVVNATNTGDTVTTKGGDGVTVTFANGVASVNSLDAGESVTFMASNGDKTVYSTLGNLVKAEYYVAGSSTLTTSAYYDGVDTATLHSASFADYSAGKFTTSLTALTPVANVNVADVTDGTTYYTAAGYAIKDPVSAPDDYAAKLVVSGSTRTLDVTAELTTSFTFNSAATTVTDKTGAAKFNVVRGKDTSQIASKGFTVSDDGVISNTTGTVTVKNDTSTFAVSGNVDVDITAITTGANGVTYVAGTGVNEAKIVYSASSSVEKIVLTESTNSTDTLVTKAGNIVGLDADGVVKGLADSATVKTAGSDTSANEYTINGVAWTVTGDEDAVFTVNGTTNGTSKVSSIDGLELDATVATKQKFSDETIVVNTGSSFQNIISKDGVTFTSTSKNTKASITLDAKGESVTIANGGSKYVYTVSSTTDGVTIDGDTTKVKITGLTDGDILTVHKVGTPTDDATKDVITLTANNGALVVSGVDANGKELNSRTYNRDSDETSFTVTNLDFNALTGNYADVTVTGGAAGADIAGFSVKTGEGDTTNITSITNGEWIDKDGKVLADNSANKAVAQILIDDEKVTYTEIGDKAQTVKVTTAETTHEWNITTNGGKDDIDYQGKQQATITSGAGNDSVNVKSDADVTINLGAGKDEVTIAGAGAHTVVAGDGDKTIDATGTTGDVVIDGRGSGKKNISRLNATKGEATLYGGDGNDTIAAAGLDDSVVGGAGNNLFDVSKSSMKVSDYDVSKDTFLVSSTTNMNFAGDGFMTVGSGTTAVTVDVSAGTGTGDYYAVSAKSTASGAKAELFGWTSDNGSTIDVSSTDKAVTLIGTHNDGAKDLLVGSKKNDVIYGGTNDSIYGGGSGKNSLYANGVSGYVGVGGAGKDTVYAFSTGFDITESDAVMLVDGDISSASISMGSTNNATIKSGSASLELRSLTKDATSGAYKILVGDKKVYSIAEGDAVSLTGDNYADYYIGTKSSKVDASKVDSAISIDLSDTEHIRNIKQVTGGADNTTLMGSGVDATLSAGTGSATLWGGAGKDSLVGGSAADTFVFMAGDGKDTISSFATGTGDNSDVLDFWKSSATGVTRTSASQFKVTMSDNDAVTVNTSTSGGANDVIQWKDENGNKGTVKVGIKGSSNTFTYDSSVGGYFGSSSGTDKLTISGSDDVNVWLDGSQGTVFADLNEVDASAATGSAILAGDSSSQTIKGGRGASSLWGGAGNAADTLVAGNGTGTFFYGYGNGNDVVNGTKADDVINLFDITLNDLTGYEIKGDKVTITTKAGETLTVNGKATTYLVGDGQGNVITAHANHSTNSWE